MTDPATDAAVQSAKSIYRARRLALIEKLKERGLNVPDRDGLCLWLPVRSEQYALVTLAARGIAVLPGKKCSVTETQHIRVATSLLVEQVDVVADALALIHPTGTRQERGAFGRYSV